MSEMIERVARAIEGAEVGYHLRLTSMIDGVSTYTLSYEDGSAPLTFENIDDGYAHIAARKREKQARAAIKAMRVPNSDTSALRLWNHMIDEALKD